MERVRVPSGVRGEEGEGILAIILALECMPLCRLWAVQQAWGDSLDPSTRQPRLRSAPEGLFDVRQLLT